MSSYVQETPVFRPTKEEFSRPFCEYIKKVLRKNPDVAMFKVVPPEGWKPRRTPFPKLSNVEITCPIKQLVLGVRGTYRCMLVEQKPLTVADFRGIAAEEGHQPPSRDKDKEDALLERAFWSSVTINPPLYGADTPMSFFDEKLAYGWNLRDLGCLLKRPHVPQVPGVTTPMTYFGMWKSFFAWHVEDADLFSINYLHFGAPKVWYCVSPSSRGKFERMAQSMFPELHRSCGAFLRHKDILLSPNTLKTYGVEYMQAKQEPNEFIVLNAGAYHAGYNLGFNCAEAVNFATDEWIEVGRNVTRCRCSALAEGVRISMRLFGCSSDSSSDEDESDEEEEDSGSEDGSSGEEQSSEEEEEAKGGRRSGRRRGGGEAAAAAAAAPRGKRAAPEPEDAPAKRQRGAAAAAAAAAAAPKGPRQTKTSMAAAAAAAKMRRTHATAEARAKLAGARERVAKARGGSGTAAAATPRQPRPSSAAPSARRSSGSGGKAAKRAAVAKPVRIINRADTIQESLARAAAAAAAIRARAEAEAAAQMQQREREEAETDHEEEQQGHQGLEDDEQQQQQQQQRQGSGRPPLQEDLSPTAAQVLTRRRSSGTNPPAGDVAAAVAAAAAAAAPDLGAPRAAKAQLLPGGLLSPGFGGGVGGAAPAPGSSEPPSGEEPKVIVGEDGGSKYFYMVQVLRDAKPKQRGRLVMRWLKEGRDGLFRPSSDTWEELPGALVGVRTQWVPGCDGRSGGYRLLTLRSRILDTELVG